MLGDYNNEWNEKVDEFRAEVLFAIKERCVEIVGSDLFKPIKLNGPQVVDNSIRTTTSLNNLKIHNIYIDENGKLCSDMVNRENSINSEFIFGRNIESLFIEDLVKVLDKLYENNNYCVACQDSDSEFTIPVKKSFFKTLLNTKNFNI